MINAKMVKILGLVATAVGMGATLLTDWVNEKKMEEKIDERINEKLAALNDEEEESYYIGFRTEKFEEQTISEREEPEQSRHNGDDHHQLHIMQSAHSAPPFCSF